MSDKQQPPAQTVSTPVSSSADASDLVKAIHARTPARILVGRAGPCYRTATQLELRHDHAFAVDAVHAELDLERDFGRDFVEHWQLFEVGTCAGSKAEYLVRPDLGHQFGFGEHKRVSVLRAGCAANRPSG